jgi:nucleotide-binding universal stress UspA family protein
MATKDILVHLDASPAAEMRLEVAACLAQRLGAHLTALFVADVTLPMFAVGDGGSGAGMAELIAELRQDALEEAGTVEAMFRARLQRAGLHGEWRLSEGVATAQVALHGRYADLLVVGQPDPDSPASTTEAVMEAALLDTGRPVLMVPYVGDFPRVGHRVLIGWNGSREAARAVHDALPLLAGAASVTVLIVDPSSGGASHGEEPGADIARHLVRHGLPVEVRRVIGAGVPAGDVLLNEAADLGADLIVMGGYGHSRIRELMLGGVTRTLLRQMTAPVFMAH